MSISWMKPMNRWLLGTLLVCMGVVSPSGISDWEPTYPEAHALIGKLILKGVKFEARLILKNWLKGIAKREGKRVAMAAVKSLKALPRDADFRMAVTTALAGGSYAQAADLIGRRTVYLMRNGARSQWQADKQYLDEHPEIIRQSLRQASGDTIERQWNDMDDQYTCGKNNVDIELQAVNQSHSNQLLRYTASNTPNEKLLTGRAFLQRAIFNGLIRNSSFQNKQQAQATAAMYSRLACFIGKSRKITAFMGGLALHGKAGLPKLENIRDKSMRFMEEIDRWAQRKL